MTDFGLVKKLDCDEETKTFCGTSEYMAPETILERGTGRAADWWALGVLLYELLFGAPPFFEEDPQRMYLRTLVEKLHFPKDSALSEEGRDFIS